jgi:glycosyltransferase involved in cell wall biosynthesis
MKPKRVALCSQFVEGGGTERQLRETALHLDPARFAPQVISFWPRAGAGEDELRRAGIPHWNLHFDSFGSPAAIRAAWRLARYLRQEQIDLFHAFDFPAACFGVPVARWAGVPVVLSSQRAFRTLYAPRYQRWLRWSDRRVDGCVVNCEVMRRHMIEDEWFPAGKIRLCYNALDTGHYAWSPRVPVPEVEGAQVVVGVVCAFRPEKGLSTLVEAFAEIQRPGVQLLLVGGGELQGQLESLCAQLGVKAVFAPFARDVRRWLHAIDIFVLPSLSEALSNSLMEAMATGCTAVASDTGGNPELVQPEETGLLFPPGDAPALARQLRRLVDDPALRAALGRRGADFIHATFSRGASLTRMAAIYDEFLQTRGHGER